MVVIGGLALSRLDCRRGFHSSFRVLARIKDAPGRRLRLLLVVVQCVHGAGLCGAGRDDS